MCIYIYIYVYFFVTWCFLSKILKLQSYNNCGLKNVLSIEACFLSHLGISRLDGLSDSRFPPKKPTS